MTDTLNELLGVGVPLLVALMVIASVVHASFAARRPAPAGPFFGPRVILVCLLHLLIAGAFYRALIIGGWLTNSYYRWDDPDDINLVLAIFEPVCAVLVIAMLFTRRRFLYKLLVDLLVLQLLFSAAFLGMMLLFALTWKPRMF